MDFCRLVGAEPYVAANITSLTPLRIRDWMEYCNFPQGSTTLAKVFCGANGHDVSWTRRIMQEYSSHKYHIIPSYGMSIHYYCGGGEYFLKTEEEWYDSMFRAAKMQRIIDDHRAAMDEFDPERKIKLIVDEWGNWHKEGSGLSKGYNLYEQQSTMRNAVVAALTLTLSNLHMTEEKIIAISAIGGKLQGKAVLSILSHPDVDWNEIVLREGLS